MGASQALQWQSDDAADACAIHDCSFETRRGRTEALSRHNAGKRRMYETSEVTFCLRLTQMPASVGDVFSYIVLQVRRWRLLVLTDMTSDSPPPPCCQ